MQCKHSASPRGNTQEPFPEAEGKTVEPRAVRCEGCGCLLPGWRALYASSEGLLVKSLQEKIGRERRTSERYGPISTPQPHHVAPCTAVGCHPVPLRSFVVGRKQATSPTLTSRWVAPHQPAVESEITSSNYSRPNLETFCASDISSSPGVNQLSAVPAGARVWGTRTMVL